VTDVIYATGLDEDTVSIKCLHPVERMTLQVVLTSNNIVWECSGPFEPLKYSGDNAMGTVTVSPADLNGRTSCSLGALDNSISSLVGNNCSFLYAPGTAVTATASTSQTFLGWQTLATPAYPMACVGTTTAACSLTLTESRTVRAALHITQQSAIVLAVCLLALSPTTARASSCACRPRSSGRSCARSRAASRT
jgi:hypothetical protein